jgi:hypothetical protein
VYCAQCRAEYRQGFTECSTCLVPLIEGDAPSPPSDEEQWTPMTGLGSKGTKLIFLYLVQVFVIGIAILFRGLQLGALPFIGAICGIASGVGILTRNRLGLHLVYAFLAILLVVSVVDFVLKLQVAGMDSAIVGKVVGGIFVPIAWFLYFRRRRNLFA